MTLSVSFDSALCQYLLIRPWCRNSRSLDCERTQFFLFFRDSCVSGVLLAGQDHPSNRGGCLQYLFRVSENVYCFCCHNCSLQWQAAEETRHFWCFTITGTEWQRLIDRLFQYVCLNPAYSFSCGCSEVSVGFFGVNVVLCAIMCAVTSNPASFISRHNVRVLPPENKHSPLHHAGTHAFSVRAAFPIKEHDTKIVLPETLWFWLFSSQRGFRERVEWCVGLILGIQGYRIYRMWNFKLHLKINCCQPLGASAKDYWPNARSWFPELNKKPFIKTGSVSLGRTQLLNLSFSESISSSRPLRGTAWWWNWGRRCVKCMRFDFTISDLKVEDQRGGE